MLRMRNKMTEDVGVLVWIGDSWHLLYARPGIGRPLQEMKLLSEYTTEADELSYLLDELAVDEWEVIG